MKKVWKCGFCPETNVGYFDMEEHEKTCSFNPDVKNCFTCKNAYECGAPISGSMTGCKKNLDTTDGIDDGNCEGWEPGEMTLEKLLLTRTLEKTEALKSLSLEEIRKTENYEGNLYDSFEEWWDKIYLKKFRGYE